jgi:hypothetical protein
MDDIGNNVHVYWDDCYLAIAQQQPLFAGLLLSNLAYFTVAT